MSDCLLTELMSDTYERSVCDDPFCGCIVLYLSEKKNPTAKIDLDCMRRQVAELSDDCQLTESDVEKHLSGNDWDTLLEEFICLKWETLTQCPNEHLVSDAFDFHNIYERGQLVGFHEIFSALGGHPRTCNERRVIILDSYCIRSGCQCGKASLEFIEIDERGDNHKTIAAFDLDLTDMSWKAATGIQETSTLPCRQILKDFLAEHCCQERLRMRQEILHGTYMRSMDHYDAAPAPYQAEVKPGRNEPCPCGSGKKYKKCCARKA